MYFYRWGNKNDDSLAHVFILSVLQCKLSNLQGINEVSFLSSELDSEETAKNHFWIITGGNKYVYLRSAHSHDSNCILHVHLLFRTDNSLNRLGLGFISRWEMIAISGVFCVIQDNNSSFKSHFFAVKVYTVDNPMYFIPIYSNSQVMIIPID